MLNNQGWHAIHDLQIDAFGEGRGTAAEFRDRKGESYSPRFAEIAEGFGAQGERIERPDEVQPALARAFHRDGPSLIEVMVNQEYPQSGGLVTGWWDIPVPAQLTERRRRYLEERSEEYLN